MRAVASIKRTLEINTHVGADNSAPLKQYLAKEKYNAVFINA